ncbi:hypothetical protein AQJ91_30470 [Streptomyces dysideae]|uniref:Uncharacterized protein n=2 Tax=Streptomyces dysideae TaxID=909626 RepID=A0A101UVB4_9ACTN|nr:hypothetical protein AQJ91_30470 [Streptomyces dysideae]
MRGKSRATAAAAASSGVSATAKAGTGTHAREQASRCGDLIRAARTESGACPRRPRRIVGLGTDHIVDQAGVRLEPTRQEIRLHVA